MGNYCSYMRISTKENNDKQSFNRQEKSLKTYAKDNNIEYLIDFKDDITGSIFDRPSWSKLEKILQKGDTIIFKEIYSDSKRTINIKYNYRHYNKKILIHLVSFYLPLYAFVRVSI
ncbi:recombinase family protein [Sarcina ventriculi]|uniref:recombinase family protein n=1 Tax=Sarcina ventriculi TaxID=1267 RepID=UPI001C113F24|nr:recombinase family protein [Sarcina ventriculi]MBU5323633.1 recombinase family protein [Sarcina ventriculi]